MSLMFARTARRAVWFLVICFAIIEAMVRLLGLAPTIDDHALAYVNDPYLPYKPRPGSTISGQVPSGEFKYEYKFNSLGLRDIEHAIEKPPGVFRILGLGDSFTMGAGVDFNRTYLAVLEQMLNSRSGFHPKVEIIKAGISGYFTQSERLLFEHYGAQYQPDLVIIGFHPNDIIDAHFGLGALQVDREGRLRSRESMELGTAGSWLYRHSQFCRVWFACYVSWQIKRGNPIEWGDLYRPNGALEPDWRSTENELGNIIRLANSILAKTLLINIPAQGPWDSSSSYVGERLLRWSQQHDSAFLDTLPDFKAYTGELPLFYRKDGHCTESGYSIIAQSIVKKLIEEGIVP